MVSTTACGRPLKSAASHPGATHEGSTDLDAGAKWCRAPEKGGPSFHTCIEPEASCVPVRPCRGGPQSGRNTAGSGRTRGKQTGLPELPRIDSRSAGSSRDGVAILRGK